MDISATYFRSTSFRVGIKEPVIYSLQSLDGSSSFHFSKTTYSSPLFVFFMLSAIRDVSLLKQHWERLKDSLWSDISETKDAVTQLVLVPLLIYFFSCSLRSFCSQEVCQTGVRWVMNSYFVCQKVNFRFSVAAITCHFHFIPWHVRRPFSEMISNSWSKGEFVDFTTLQSPKWCFYTSHVSLSFLVLILLHTR